MYWSDVSAGIAATSATKPANRTICGVRSRMRRAPPSTPVRILRSSARATHSSTPIWGEVEGGGPGGVGMPVLTSDLLEQGCPADTRRPDQHEDDQHREYDQVPEGRREIAGGQGLCDADDHSAEHRTGD